VLLQVKNLNIFYRNSIYIEDVNFSLNKGEIFSIVGESGSGKTLTALAIINLLPDFFLSKGEIFFKNLNILNLSEEEIRKIRGRYISFIFQDPMVSLNPVLKVGYQLAEMFIYHFKNSKKVALTQAQKIFEKFKISHIFDSYPHQLSGGMRQRVMIAMAVSCEPEIIIADEPSTALDVTVQEEILDLLHFIVKNEDKALLLITHDINILGEYADRVMVMYAGRVMEMGSVEEIFNNPLHPYTKALLNCIPKPGAVLKSIKGTIPNLKGIPKGCAFHPRCEEKLNECGLLTPHLIEKSPGHWVRCLRYS